MTRLPPELASLPAPSLIEEIAYETRLSMFRLRLQEAYDAAGIPYDVGELQTDPVQILLQVGTYQDMLIRQRINEAVRGTLLPYAVGGDLDILAQFYDVTRLAGEDDDRLRARIVLAIRGRSTGGTEPRYRSVAMEADLRVANVSVYTVGRDPTIRVAVYATDNGGVADEALIAAVDAALQSPAVRMVNDRIVVSAAARTTIAVAADIWVLPQTSTAIVIAMEAALRAAWAQQIGLGRDVTRAWLTAQLMLEGVQRVEITAPLADVVIPADQAGLLGAVSLVVKGRDF